MPTCNSGVSSRSKCCFARLTIAISLLLLFAVRRVSGVPNVASSLSLELVRESVKLYVSV